MGAEAEATDAETVRGRLAAGAASGSKGAVGLRLRGLRGFAGGRITVGSGSGLGSAWTSGISALSSYSRPSRIARAAAAATGSVFSSASMRRSSSSWSTSMRTLMRLSIWRCEIQRARYSPILDTLAHGGLAALVEPTVKGKVDALRAVKAEVESRVVAAGVGYDKLSRVLHKVVRTDGRLREQCR